MRFTNPCYVYYLWFHQHQDAQWGHYDQNLYTYQKQGALATYLSLHLFQQILYSIWLLLFYTWVLFVKILLLFKKLHILATKKIKSLCATFLSWLLTQNHVSWYPVWVLYLSYYPSLRWSWGSMKILYECVLEYNWLQSHLTNCW